MTPKTLALEIPTLAVKNYADAYQATRTRAQTFLNCSTR